MCLLSLSVFTGALCYWTATAPAVAQTVEANNYTPTAPPESYQAVLRSNLKIVGDWIDMNDYQSAAQSQRLVAALAQLYALRSNDDKHKAQAAALRTACDKVTAALRTKNAETSKKALKDCEDAVAALTKTPPSEKAVHKNFKPFGNTQTWMMLMDCSIIDAKDTKSVEEFQQLSLAVAEQANVTSFLRNEAKWRTYAEQTRGVALKAAETAKKDGLDAGRIELKKINQTCEACHQGYKQR
jgi:cytochrome c556